MEYIHRAIVDVSPFYREHCLCTRSDTSAEDSRHWCDMQSSPVHEQPLLKFAVGRVDLLRIEGALFELKAAVLLCGADVQESRPIIPPSLVQRLPGSCY